MLSWLCFTRVIVAESNFSSAGHNQHTQTPVTFKTKKTYKTRDYKLNNAPTNFT